MNAKEVVQGMYAAAARGDIEAFVGAASEDLVLEEPAFLPFGGTYHGREGFAAMLTKAATVLDVSSLTVDHIIAEGDQAFGVIRVRAQQDGAQLIVGEESTVRDDKIIKLRIFVHDAGPLATGTGPAL